MATQETPLDVVKKLNEEITDQLCEGSDIILDCLQIKSDGVTTIIEFLGIQIWKNDDDDRQIISRSSDPHIEEDVYEDLETFVRREVNEYMDYLRKLKL